MVERIIDKRFMLNLLTIFAASFCVMETSSAVAGDRADKVYFYNATTSPIKVECTSYVDAAGTTQKVNGTWDIPGEKGQFLEVQDGGRTKVIVAKQFNFKVNDGTSSSQWFSEDSDFTDNGLILLWSSTMQEKVRNNNSAAKLFADLAKLADKPTQTNYRPAGTEPGLSRSGQVRVVNETKYPIKVACISYVDASGVRHQGNADYWEFAPGRSAYLVDGESRITAQRFDLWLTIGNGETNWFISEPEIASDGSLTLTVNEHFVNEHLKRRSRGEGRPSTQAMQAAISKLIAAAVAQAVATSGDSSEDDLGALLVRGVAVGAREQLITSSINDLFPHFSREQESSARRVMTLLLDGRLTPASYQRETERERFITAVKRESPDLAAAADFLGFLGEVQSARQKSRR